MHVTITQTALEAALALVKPGIASNTRGLKILEHVLIEATLDPIPQIILSTTNLYLGYATVINEGITISEPGASALSGKVLSAIAKNAPKKAEIAFCVDEKEKGTARSGKRFWALSGASRDEFPVVRVADLEKGHYVCLSAKHLRKTIERLAPVAGRSTNAYILQNVLVTVENGEMTLLTSDRAQMAGQRLEIEVNSMEDLFQRWQWLLPVPALLPAVKAMQPQQDIFLGSMDREDPRWFALFDGQTTVSFLQGEGDWEQSFPEYQKGIDRAHASTASILVRKKDLIQYLKQLKLAWGESGCVILSPGEGEEPVMLSSGDTNGEITVSCWPEATVTGEFEPIKVNGKQLAAYLQRLESEEISIGLRTPTLPFIVRSQQGLEQHAFYVQQPFVPKEENKEPALVPVPLAS